MPDTRTIFSRLLQIKVLHYLQKLRRVLNKIDLKMQWTAFYRFITIIKQNPANYKHRKEDELEDVLH